MISDLQWSLYHSSDYYCGVIHFVMSLASPDLHVRPLAAGGETDDLVGEAFVAHVHTSGILMSGVAVPAHFLHLGSGSVQHDVLSDPGGPDLSGFVEVWERLS